MQAICELVKDLNDHGVRCSGLPLGGQSGDLTAHQVCGWTTGYPARLSFQRGYPDYDPFLYDSQRLIESQEADCLLWLNAFEVAAAPPSADMPVLVLGRSGMAFTKEPDVFIPIGTPGIDHAGHAYRMDSVVAVRLKKLRDSGLPSGADALNAIAQQLMELS